MIRKIRIRNYRLIKELILLPNDGMNIVVGDNESGKSTILEGIALGMTGRINGRWAQEELNPYWFNSSTVADFFEALRHGSPTTPPEIHIELYLSKDRDELHTLRGVHNNDAEDCPGMRIVIDPDPDYAIEFDEFCKSSDRPDVLPVEYYRVRWLDFDGHARHQRPKELGLAVVDSRTIRSTSGVDYHTRQLVGDYIEAKDGAAISVAHRKARHEITTKTLKATNDRIASEGEIVPGQKLALQIDQSANSSWQSNVVPEINSIPFAMSGQGQQVLTKVALSLNRTAESTSVVLVEEPENHLSHTSLTRLVGLIGELAQERQTFLTTHSSYVLNRLGLQRLHLLHRGRVARFAELSDETISFFRRLSGYDTLRFVLARSIVVVEGPSDEMIFNQAFEKFVGESPQHHGVDVIAQGITNRRALELCKAPDRKVAVLRDNDGRDPSYWRDKAKEFLAPGSREMFIGSPENGATLEPQLVKINADSVLRSALGLREDEDVEEYMLANKTEAALALVESETEIAYPDYIVEAVEFIK